MFGPQARIGCTCLCGLKVSVDSEEAVQTLAQDVLRAAQALLFAAGQLAAAAVAAAAVARRTRRRVSLSVLRFLSLVGAALGAVRQTLAADTWAVMHWPLVAAFPWAAKAV